MKTISIATFTLALLICVSATAQNFFQDMENDVFKCRFYADGIFFDNPNNFGDDELSTFKYPKNYQTQTFDLASLFISAVNNDGKLCVANGMLNGKTDFSPGPIALNYVLNNSGSVDSNYDYTYNRVWKISKAQIDYHINNYSQENYNMPWVIDNWPANGNSARGESDKLAPFMDSNNNQRYEPTLGEYPLIPGDVAVYMIYNAARKDSALRITRYNIPFVAMQLEIHALAYAFNNENEDINNTLFVNYKIFNRSTNESYNDMYIGQRSYLVTNCSSTPTTVGCDSSLSYYYNYALAAKDLCDSPYTFGNYVPAFGIVFLSDTMRSFLQHDKFNSSNHGDPIFATDFSAYTRGILKDSTAFGDSCELYTGIPSTKFMLNDYPWDSSGHSVFTCNIPNGYGKCVGSIGPFNLAPQENLCIDVAFTMARDSSNSDTNFKSLEKLRLRVNNLHSLHAQGVIGCSSIPTGINPQAIAQSPLLRVYPNPANSIINVQLENNQSSIKIKEVKVYDVAGKAFLFPFEGGKGDEITLNIQHLQQSLYFIEAKLSNGSVERVKFLKQ